MSQLLEKLSKDPRQNIEQRHKILALASKDLGFRAEVKELFHRDPLFAFNGFFYTLDVRRKPIHHLPFCTYPFQDESILIVKEHIDEGKDIIIEKSRDMGWSWMVIDMFMWYWLNPRGGADFLLGSRIEDYVDKKGDMRSLVEKARYTLYRLPKWLRPRGFNKKQHDNFMRLVNPETGSSITGESNNPNWSTGGRYKAALLDEFAKWEGSDKSAWTAAGDATPCRIGLSTPFGAGGQYYDLVHDPLKKIRILTTHWSLHPRKRDGLYCVWPRPENAAEVVNEYRWKGLRSIWYDQEDKRRSRQEMLQEIDIGYLGSGNPVFDGKCLYRIEILLKSEREAVAYMEVPEGLAEVRESPKPDEAEGYVFIYEKPNPNEYYLVTADVVEGIEGGDYAVVHVLNRRTESVVASYFCNIDEVSLARVVVAITFYYTTPTKRPYWAIETVGPGLSTFDHIMENYYLPNAFMMPTGFDHALQRPTFKKGWWTSTTSKQAIIGAIKSWLLTGTGWAPIRTVKEMTTFVRNKAGKAGAKEGCNDDEVMAFGIALKVNEILPMPEDIELVPRLENGLPETLYKPKKVEEPKSLEEECFEHLIAKKEMEESFNEDEFIADSIGCIIDPMEELGLFD